MILASLNLNWNLVVRMNIDGFEEWDDAFFDKVVQAEELALSAVTNPTQLNRHHPPPPPLPPPFLPLPPSHLSYSPPRELSQRLPQNPKGFNPLAADHNQNESETDQLKKELLRVSKQLTLLEEECLELRKERDNKEEQLKSVQSEIEAKHKEARFTKSRNIVGDSEFHIQNNHRVANNLAQIDVVCKTIGVQTDNDTEAINPNVNDDDLTSIGRHCCSEKLVGIWDRPASSWSGRNLVSSLFVTCESDLLYLFGLSKSDPPLKTTDEKFAAHKVQSEKISYFQSVLTKINYCMVTVDALLEALVDLCGVENVDIVYRSTRILGAVLTHSFSGDKKSLRRDNVTVERLHPSLTVDDVFGLESETSEIQMMESICPETILKNNKFCLDYLVFLFRLMYQIATKYKEGHVRKEALSVMSTILMRTDAYSERDKFGNVVVFQSFSELLRKDAGLDIQIQAVQLLYLLLNCPKVLEIFCSSRKEDGATDSELSTVGGQKKKELLNVSVCEGLADCLASDASCIRGLKLRRKTINLLAYLASSGKPGFEIVLGQKPLDISNLNYESSNSNDLDHESSNSSDLKYESLNSCNFLGLILQVLKSETELEETSKLVHPSEIFKERTLLVREAVIFMNRLVSNPQYLREVLEVLTLSREVASLSVEVASQLSRQVKQLWQSDTTTRHIRETEIVELGRIFRKRLFACLNTIE